jgi:phage/plasmid-like protein (TIGR03299 family)
MSHEITEYDGMISVRQAPWHGLGTVLPEQVDAFEAQRLAGLTWGVRKVRLYAGDPATGQVVDVPETWGVMRTDVPIVLGTVGKLYTPLQNDDMFMAVEQFCRTAGVKVETCGSLKEGRVVWALAGDGETEFVRGDPLTRYFLFKNSFDGSTAVDICYTDVRVVCMNTLNLALRNARNRYVIRHSPSMSYLVEASVQALAARREWDSELRDLMRALAEKPLTGAQVKELTAKLVLSGVRGSAEMSGDRLLEKRAGLAILRLVDSGAGADLPGVRGTAYGWLQAAAEYADHGRRYAPRTGDAGESRFLSVIGGEAARIKQTALRLALAA